MIASSISHQVDTHSVRLRIEGQATIDLDNSPASPRPVPVTELAVVYTTTRSGDSAEAPRTEVTSISYVLDDDEDKAAFVHPDYLDQPGEWPEWVRTLIDQHKPAVAARLEDDCPQCAAPAAGNSIPKHRTGCPRSNETA